MSDRLNVVAIDGPAGAGKSTVAREVARRLGFTYLDSGAMYRVVGVLARERGLDLADEQGVGELARQVRIEFERDADGGQRVLADGRDLSGAIRVPAAGPDASAVSKLGPVRSALGAEQRRLGEGGAVVMEGRDIGTVIFPDAALKVFLTATPEERARRRVADLEQRGHPSSYSDVLSSVRSRDEQDSGRELAPLKPADDARLLDSSALSMDEVVERICAWAAESMNGAS